MEVEVKLQFLHSNLLTHNFVVSRITLPPVHKNHNVISSLASLSNPILISRLPSTLPYG
jgi:hypothetical protein